MSQGLFSGVGEADLQRNSAFIRGGRYIFKIKQFKAGRTRKHVDFACFEYICLHIVDPTGAEDSPLGPHRPGDQVSWMIMKTWDSFDSSIKTAIVNMFECDPEEVNEDMLTTMVSDAQPLAGLCVEVDAQVVPTKKDGGKFTRVNVVRRIEEEELRSILDENIYKKFVAS